MRKELLSWYSNKLLKYHKPILAFSFLSIIIALVVSYFGLEMQASREALSSKTDAASIRMERFLNEFETTNSVIVLVEGSTLDRKKQFADRLAEQLQQEQTYFSEIFYKLDMNYFESRGLLFLDLADLHQLAANIEENQDDIIRFSKIASAQALLESFLHQFAHPDPEQMNRPEAAQLQGLMFVTQILQALADAAAGRNFSLNLEAMMGDVKMPDSGGFDRDGYLVGNDGEFLLLLLTPVLESESLEHVEPLIDYLKALLAQVQTDFPDIKAGYTGYPGLIYDEMKAVRYSNIIANVVGFSLVAMLFFLFFREFYLPAITMSVLVVALSWSLMVTALTVGYLNILSSAFLLTLIGLGITYGIHIVFRYEVEQEKEINFERSVSVALNETGKPLLTGCLTTAAAFYTLLLCKFKGFRELGFISGNGVILCLLAMISLLPISIYAYQKRLSQKEKEAAVLGRKWREGFREQLRRFYQWIISHPRFIVIAAIAITAVLGWFAQGVGFNYNLLDLQPRDSVAVKNEYKLMEDPRFSPEINVLIADNLAEERKFIEKLSLLETVGRAEGISRFIPAQQEQKLAILHKLKPIFAKIEIPSKLAKDVNIEALKNTTDKLITTCENLQESLFETGKMKLLAEFEKITSILSSLSKTLQQKSNDTLKENIRKFESAFINMKSDTLGVLKRHADVEQVTVENLPSGLRNRFIGRTGKHLVNIYPNGEIWDEDYLARFIADCRSVSREVTGFPDAFYDNSNMIFQGFRMGAIYSLTAVCLLVFLDFRKVTYTLLAMIPLVVGMVWMLGIMSILGIEYNLANLVALPLVFGIGVDFGVHILHRFKLEPSHDITFALRGTGRAILLSGLATMAAFGSMSLCAHQGMASLGFVLLIGVFSCLALALLIVPALLAIFSEKLKE